MELKEMKVPDKWQIKETEDDTFTFKCSNCSEEYKFKVSDVIENKIHGLIKTNYEVESPILHSISKILAIFIAVIAYYYTHRWIYGPHVPLLQHVTIPVFVAVVVYQIAKVLLLPILRFTPIIGALTLIGRVPIYNYKCDKCQSDIFFALSKKKFAVPLIDSKKMQGG